MLLFAPSVTAHIDWLPSAGISPQENSDAAMRNCCTSVVFCADDYTAEDMKSLDAGISPRTAPNETLQQGLFHSADYPIIVHSHLGWDWVWQRPQQFLSRLSKTHPVLFIEGPCPTDEVQTPKATLREISDYPNIVVLQMQMPASRWNDGGWIDKERRHLVQTLLAGPLGRRFESPVQWFYDPMAVTAFAGHLNERAIVYDCMDELSLFRGAPPELVRRERELLAVADVVFAGGPKMWRAKKEYNANCFCFGCGVDAKHFATAREAELSLPSDLSGIGHPIYGYVGVVDERIDYDLVAALADHGGGDVVMVGPTTKVDPASLPQRPNLHWL